MNEAEDKLELRSPADIVIDHINSLPPDSVRADYLRYYPDLVAILGVITGSHPVTTIPDYMWANDPAAYIPPGLSDNLMITPNRWLVNTDIVTEIIMNNISYFPEITTSSLPTKQAINDLIISPSTKQNAIKLGILSGYPIKSVIAFTKKNKLLKLLNIPPYKFKAIPEDIEPFKEFVQENNSLTGFTWLLEILKKNVGNTFTEKLILPANKVIVDINGHKYLKNSFVNKAGQLVSELLPHHDHTADLKQLVKDFADYFKLETLRYKSEKNVGDQYSLSIEQLSGRIDPTHIPYFVYIEEIYKYDFYSNIIELTDLINWLPEDLRIQLGYNL